MKIGDSRIRGGPGILPLQHHGYVADKWPLWNRASILAVRITGRADNQGGTGSDNAAEVGHWFEDPETRGDLIGGAFWQRTSRPVGGWRFSWPVTTTDKNVSADSPPSGSQSKPGLKIGIGGDAFGKQQQRLTDMFGPFGAGAGEINTQIVEPPTKANAPKPGEKENDPSVVLSGGSESGCATQKNPLMIPIFSGGWDKDSRLSVAPYTSPDVWPKFPIDWYGITLAADNENTQQELYYPCDPRMVAVHCNGDEAMGSLVGDMAPGFKLDSDKMARLQSVWKVAKKPKGCSFSSADNTIAWNIGETGCKDSNGGLIWEKEEKSKLVFTPPRAALPITKTTPGGDRSQVVQKDPASSISLVKERDGDDSVAQSKCPKGKYGHVSQRHGGPFELDCGQDHQIGEDGDGNPIYPVHLSMNSYFTFPGGVFDGPLKHDGLASSGGAGPIVMNVGFGFEPSLPHNFTCGPRAGKHRWWSYSFLYFPSSPPGDPPTWAPIIIPPIIDVPETKIPGVTVISTDPLEKENGLVLSGGPGVADPEIIDKMLELFGPENEEPFSPIILSTGTTEENVKAYGVTDGLKTFGATTLEGSSPCILFRPQIICGDCLDFLNLRAPDQEKVKLELDHVTPITGKLQAWGAQGDKTGATFLTSAGHWAYTHKPGTYRYGGGTAPGGMCLLPPEVSLSDIDNGLVPMGSGVITSDTSLVAGPGASLGCGMPDLQNGGLASGFTLFDDTGDLRIASNLDSVSTNRMVVHSGGNVGIGTDTAANLLHLKDSGTGTINVDMLCVESAGNTSADSWGIKFLNAAGDKAKIRATQASSATNSGTLEFSTADAGSLQPTTFMDETGKWSFQSSLIGEVFSIDPEGVFAGSTSGILSMGINTPDLGSGVGVLAVGNAAAPPSTTPIGGGVIFVDGGALKYIGSSGTTTTIASP